MQEMQDLSFVIEMSHIIMKAPLLATVHWQRYARPWNKVGDRTEYLRNVSQDHMTSFVSIEAELKFFTKHKRSFSQKGIVIWLWKDCLQKMYGPIWILHRYAIPAAACTDMSHCSSRYPMLTVKTVSYDHLTLIHLPKVRLHFLSQKREVPFLINIWNHGITKLFKNVFNF